VKEEQLDLPGLDDLRLLAEGKSYAGALEAVAPVISKLGATLVAQTCMRAEQGKLTPEGAMQAWMELLGYRKLLRKLQTGVEVGKSAAEEHAKRVNKQD
jgi:hypothetical protein